MGKKGESGDRRSRLGVRSGIQATIWAWSKHQGVRQEGGTNRTGELEQGNAVRRPSTLCQQGRF